MTDSTEIANLSAAITALKAGEVIAYPTEAVYGLGCNPFDEQAMNRLFHVKQRPVEKGVILIAASIEQVAPFVYLTGETWQSAVIETWPGPVTWVLPAKPEVPDWITGGRETVAVRVSAHPVVQAICNGYGYPIVSTSANITAQPPAMSCAEVAAMFGDELLCVGGELGQLDKPTQIFDAQTGQRLR